MAFYGDQLAFFGEQFIRIKNYSMEPKAVAGFNERVFICDFRGVLQELKGGSFDEEGETLNDTEVPTVWTRKSLKTGTFIVPDEGDYKGVIYRITNPQGFKLQGGFYSYTLQKVVGSTDEQKDNPSVDYGVGAYE